MSSYTVNTLSDAVNPGLGLLTLRQAVTSANAHAGADTVVFSSALFSSSGQKTITLTQGEIDLTDKSGATTIVGPGAAKLAVSGNSLSRVFDVHAGVTATVSGMTLIKGVGSIGPDTRFDGGAIISQGTLTLTSMTLSKNKGSPANAADHSTHGGAIFSSGTLTIQSSTLSGNTATGGNNGFSGAGGAIFSTGPLTITASTLTGNLAAGGTSGGNAMGGALYESGPVGKLTLSGSTLSNNNSEGGTALPFGAGGTGSGGAIFTTTSTSLTSSTITGNKANGKSGMYNANGGGYGGGVWTAGSLVISACAITGNSISSGNDENPAGNANNKHADGAGVYSLGSLSLVQSTVSGNSAVGGNGLYDFNSGSVVRGGGVFASGILTVSASSITGNHVTGGIGNPATGLGSGAPLLHSGPGGDSEGAGLWCGNTSTITNSTIANNSAIGGVGGSAVAGAPPDQTSAGNGGNASGGGVYAFGMVKILDSTLSGNTVQGGAGGAGGALKPGKNGTSSGAGLVVAKNSTLLNNTIISANKAAGVFNDIGGTVVSTSANNLIGVGGGLINGIHGNKVGVTNPMLTTLGNHGGTTQTMVPLAGSPAINAGSNALIPAGVTTDQRGLKRIINGVVDIGAAEVGASLSGQVFNDANANGKLDPATDKGLAKWTVYLDINKNGKPDASDIVTTTDSTGAFSFYSLAPVTYVTRIVSMPSYKPTNPAGAALTLTLAVGQASTGNLFGEAKI